MDEVYVYWTIIVALLSGAWVITAFLRDRVTQSIERSRALIAGLLEDDMLVIEKPNIQKYMSQNVEQDEAYFLDPERLKEDIFYKAKTSAYKKLNFFDEILSVSSRTSGWWGHLMSVPLIESADWEEYMIEKLRHPLYSSILNHEGRIFGASLRKFWVTKKEKIESQIADPFIW